jgi:hypothetical protein
VSRRTEDTVTQMLVKTYGEGVEDGIESTLRLMLGQPVSGATPYHGPLPDELRAWIETALQTIATDP